MKNKLLLLAYCTIVHVSLQSEDLIAECEKRHLYITDIDRQLPILMHAPLGTAIAKEKYDRVVNTFL